MLDYSYIQKNKEVLNDDQWHSRVAECPLECNDNILIEDRLEKGCIRIYDYTGGAIELPNSLHDMQDCKNAPLVAWMSVAILPKRKEVWLEDADCNYGYDMYMSLIVKRVLHFAKFYQMKFCISDLRKGDIFKTAMQLQCIDIKCICIQKFTLTEQKQKLFCQVFSYRKSI